MNRLPLETRCRMLQLMVEGNSLRGITRILGISINTVTKFLEDMGQAALSFQNEAFQNLDSKRIILIIFLRLYSPS